MRKAFCEQGAAGLAHGNRGKPPANAVKAVVALAQTDAYARCNRRHFTELLAEREGTVLFRLTVRWCLLAAGIRSPRRRKEPQHRGRRERMAQEGMLLQWADSRHGWLGRAGSMAHAGGGC